MPNRWPIADGNWSVPEIWSGSLIPTSADDVFTNNRRVNIDIDTTIRSIRNSATGSAVASAAQANCFYLNDGVTLTANAGGVIGAVTNGAFFPTIIVSGSNSARIIANITSSVQYGNAILLLDGASLTITGSIIPGLTEPGQSQQRTIRSFSTGSLRISGSILNGGGTYFGATLTLNAATRVDINGNLFGSPNVSAYYTIDNSAAAIVTVTGSLIGGSSSGILIGNFSTGICIISGSVTSGAGGLGILNNSTGTIIVTGSVTAEAGGYGISNASTGTVSVSGSVTAGTGNSGIISTTAGRITVIGPISASRSFPGIQSTSTGNVFLTGPFLNINNRNAVFAQNLQLISGSTPTWQFDTETYGGTKILYTSGSVTGYPSISNVRNGVIYGDTNQFTGTVVIPAASNVIRGALVGNTTGSASFTTQNAWSAATGSLTVSGSIGARLRNTATVNTDAALITTRRKI